MLFDNIKYITIKKGVINKNLELVLFTDSDDYNCEVLATAQNIDITTLTDSIKVEFSVRTDSTNIKKELTVRNDYWSEFVFYKR